MSVLSRGLRGGAIAVLLAAHGSFALAASATLDRIRSSGTIQLAYRDGAAPFSFRDRDGTVRGYSVELCDQVARRIGKTLNVPSLRIEWKPVNASTRLDAVANGDADIECGTTTMTLGRMEKVDFSVPIFVDGGSVLVRANARVEIRVKMDAGGVRVVSHDYEPALREGDRVRLYGTQLELIPA